MLGCEIEQQIHGPQAEKRNVSEAIEPPFHAGVATQPVFTLKEKAQDHSRREAQQDANPGGDEIQLRRLPRGVHGVGYTPRLYVSVNR